MTDIYELTRNIIKENRFFSLATSNSSGEIWATPLSYAFDVDYNFYFVTAIDSKHIEHIKENPYVAFTIFDSTRRVSEVDGLQIKGLVGEVEKEKLPEIVNIYYAHVFPDPIERKEWEAEPENFMKNDFPVYRFFQVLPLEIYKRDTINTDCDRRVQIDINKLRGN